MCLLLCGWVHKASSHYLIKIILSVITDFFPGISECNERMCKCCINVYVQVGVILYFTISYKISY